MRHEPNMFIEHLRWNHPMLGGGEPGRSFGCFHKGPLMIISSGSHQDNPWEHVSVSCANRCPTWEEMNEVKDLFWDEEETVVQIHPPRSQYVNRHPYCLHLWKKRGENWDLPPKEMVG